MENPWESEVGEEADCDSRISGLVPTLVLPDVPEVLEQVSSSTGLTYLSIALGVVARLGGLLHDGRSAEELRFLHDCLLAGHAQTKLLCGAEAEVGQAHLSGGPKLLRGYSSHSNLLHRTGVLGRRGSAMSGATRQSVNSQSSVVTHLTDHSTATPPGDAGRHGSKLPSANPKRKDFQLRGALFRMRSSEGDFPLERCPWMGPAVPRWPVADLAPSIAAKLESQYAGFDDSTFDVFALAALTGGKPLPFAGWEALLRSGAFSEFPIMPDKVASFLQHAEGLYMGEQKNAYHNSIHAADVTQTVYMLTVNFGFGEYFDPMDNAVATLSAIIHDMGHDGRNNVFHINARDDLALTYNDRSVLENYHVSLAFKLMQSKESTNFLSELSHEQFLIMRSEIVDMVLSTDMSQHYGVLHKFEEFTERFNREPGRWQMDESAMGCLRGMLLHCADISNPCKPYHIAYQWAARCLQEFFAQGDAEKMAGLPVSPLCDRTHTELAASQLGFIKFIVQPTYGLLACLMPKAKSFCSGHIVWNIEAWEAKSKQSAADRAAGAERAAPETEKPEPEEPDSPMDKVQSRGVAPIAVASEADLRGNPLHVDVVEADSDAVLVRKNSSLANRNSWCACVTFEFSPSKRGVTPPLPFQTEDEHFVTI